MTGNNRMDVTLVWENLEFELTWKWKREGIIIENGYKKFECKKAVKRKQGGGEPWNERKSLEKSFEVKRVKNNKILEKWRKTSKNEKIEDRKIVQLKRKLKKVHWKIIRYWTMQKPFQRSETRVSCWANVWPGSIQIKIKHFLCVRL